ncbi:hypothetical protein ACH4S9_37070 [Streptomyces sp. NPDC021225]|uniref:hypothetical protein n=1 Tax=Streptomyces sp. NPDC021225 TaxID=3365121 RepID=UPI00379D2A32
MAGAGQDVGESLWRHAVTAVQQAFAALVVSTFVYHFLSLGVMGRTQGAAGGPGGAGPGCVPP